MYQCKSGNCRTVLGSPEQNWEKGELLAERREHWKKREVKVFGSLQAVPEDQHSLWLW